MMVPAVQWFGGLVADLALGDPRWLPHPVAGIGRLASLFEKAARRTRLPLKVSGGIVWALIAAAVAAVIYASIVFLPAPYVQIYWIYSFLAIRSLDDHARPVIRALERSDLASARLAVARIVGRDTGQLDESGILRATIETVSESLNDGIVAPLFWLAIGGPIAMGAYKAINTLDSMFGYRNERYKDFGWVSARMDDLANYVPARLTAALIILLAILLPNLNARRSKLATLRDAHRQPSPNSGYPEAATAGALGIQLGGTNFYGGIPSHKATLGEAVRPLSSPIYRELRWILYGVPILGSALLYGGASLWR